MNGWRRVCNLSISFRHVLLQIFLFYFFFLGLTYGGITVLVEVELLAKLQHPNLVSYRHVWLEDVKLNNFGPSVACAFILQQYCNRGDLLHYVIGDVPKEATKEQLKAQLRRRSKGQAEAPARVFIRRHLSYDEIFSLFQDVTSGLAYLHQGNYIHRDLKPSNCLLHKEGGALLCLISDFGEVQPENVDRKSTGATGTISYCAPEVLKQDVVTGRYGNFTYKSDMFSLGMILYFMCFGRLPYRSANTAHEELEDIDELRYEISQWAGFQDERRERPDLPAKLYQLLKKLLSINPAERPSANEVLTAMKSESHLDGVSRAVRSSSPSIGIPGRRIQNLDSPLPPSTPVPGESLSTQAFSRVLFPGVDFNADSKLPDPIKQIRPSRMCQDVNGVPDSNEPGVVTPSPKPTPRNTLQKMALPATPRLRGQTTVVTRSSDGSLPGSPERQRAISESPTRQRPVPPLSPHATTPLLMPPPTTLAEHIQHRALVRLHHFSQFFSDSGSSMALLTRVILFCVKMYTLATACHPYIPKMNIGLLLLFLAALDLGAPYRDGVAGARHARHASAGVAPGTFAVSDVLGSATLPWWARAVKWNTVLLLLHFLILWFCSTFHLLCPGI